jgi:hypothetical protein
LLHPFFHIPRLPEKVTRECMELGARILMDAQGHIFTNHHVADGATKVEVVLENGFRYDARLMRVSWSAAVRKRLPFARSMSSSPRPLSTAAHRLVEA